MNILLGTPKQNVKELDLTKWNGTIWSVQQDLPILIITLYVEGLPKAGNQTKFGFHIPKVAPVGRRWKSLLMSWHIALSMKWAVNESGIDEMFTYSPVNELAVDEMGCRWNGCQLVDTAPSYLVSSVQCLG
jgi:hypothetical protein